MQAAGCIMQVAGYDLWSRAVWLYQGAVSLMMLTFSVSGGSHVGLVLDLLVHWYVCKCKIRTIVPLEKILVCV